MTIKSATFFWAECSGCGAEIRDVDDRRALHETASAAAYEALDADWLVHPEQNAIIYCDGCPPSWCLECEHDITDTNPRCGDDAWSCASCHTNCEREEGQDQ